MLSTANGSITEVWANGSNSTCFYPQRVVSREYDSRWWKTQSTNDSRWLHTRLPTSPQQSTSSQRTYSVALSRRGWGELVAEVDASGLSAGATYSACLDLDGSGGDLAFGDTGLRIYVTPFSRVSATAVPKGPFVLRVSCAHVPGGCLPRARVWPVPRGLGCRMSAVMQGAVLQVPATGPSTLSLDAAGFGYGQSLRLCTSWGVYGAADDVGVDLFVTPITSVTPLSLGVSPGQ
ncbi:unnamed protein product, partial [Prorocentrum cordatum]